MAQQTAVEWFHKRNWELKMLLEKQQISVGEYGVAYYDIFEDAKQMEREQHGDTWDEAIIAHEGRGHVTSRSICDFDDYYNETYNQNK